MATFRKQGDKIRAEIAIKGVRKSKSFRTKAEAQHWAYEEERKIRTLAEGGKLDALFSDVLERYLKEVSITKKSYRKEMMWLHRMMDEPISNLFIADINRDDINAWIASRLSTGVKGSSVRRELSVLSNVFKFALERWNYIFKNPMIGVDVPKPEKPRNQRFTPAEIETLLELSGYHKGLSKPSARVGAAMLFAIETGMRAGEICNLTWENVYFEKRIAHLPMTKNGTARDVPLSTAAIRILKQLEEIKVDERVFQLKSDVLSRLFVEMKSGGELSHLNFHDTRREALTRLAKKVDVMTLSKISGHKDIKILVSTYYAPDMSEVANLLD